MKNLFYAVIVLLSFSSCKKEGLGTTTRSIDLANFSKLYMGYNFDITVQQGNSYSIIASGSTKDVNDLRVNVQNGVLNISYNNYNENHKRVAINITMPSLVKFEIMGNSSINVSGFTETVGVNGTISGNTKATIRMSAPEFKLDVTGSSTLNLTGQAAKVYTTASGNSEINTYAVPALVGYTEASGNSKIKIFASADLFATANGNSFIYFKGNPGNKFFSESSNSKIIEE
jgi:hypothetical protein